ncbi:MAG: PDZ domain-containing protein [Candidatus Kerfeldbacteria bacterium]|nr:PDZ domain-containing protein [Candidatus Kerfeldbacteria bacterium]
MKQQVVPTSPKSANFQSQQERQQGRALHPHLPFAVLVLSITLGTVAGFLGFFISTAIPPEMPVLGQFNVYSLFKQQRNTVFLSSHTTRESVVLQTPEVLNEIASLYSAAPNIEHDADQPSEFLANAVILTADGWMAAPTAVFGSRDMADSAQRPVVILPNGRVNTIQRVLDDPFLGITFFQVDAQELSVVRFYDSAELTVGQLYSFIEKQIGGYAITERRIAGETMNQQRVRSTLRFEHQPVIDQTTFDLNRIGSPLFHDNGSLVGVLSQHGTIIPGLFISTDLQSILASGAASHSTLDVFYVNVHQLTQQEREQRHLPESGMLVIAVPEQSGEAIFPLHAGDIITEINYRLVTDEDDLATMIHSQPVGSTWYITVQRGGVEKNIELQS